MCISRRDASASSLLDSLRTGQSGVLRKMGVLSGGKRIVNRIRRLLLPGMLLLITLSIVHVPLAHADGFYDMPVQTREMVDSSGVHAGILGTSFEFAHIAPST